MVLVSPCPTVIVTVLPEVTCVPPDGSCKMTSPICWALLGWRISWGVRPAVVMRFSAAFAVSPMTGGTATPGPSETRIVTVAPSVVAAPGPGVVVVTRPLGTVADSTYIGWN